MTTKTVSNPGSTSLTKKVELVLQWIFTTRFSTLYFFFLNYRNTLIVGDTSIAMDACGNARWHVRNGKERDDRRYNGLTCYLVEQLNQFELVNIDLDRGETHSQKVCRRCDGTIRKLKDVTRQATCLKRLQFVLQRSSSIWTAFDASVDVDDCVSCRHEADLCRPFTDYG